MKLSRISCISLVLLFALMPIASAETYTHFRPADPVKDAELIAQVRKLGETSDYLLVPAHDGCSLEDCEKCASLHLASRRAACPSCGMVSGMQEWCSGHASLISNQACSKDSSCIVNRFYYYTNYVCTCGASGMSLTHLDHTTHTKCTPRLIDNCPY